MALPNFDLMWINFPDHTQYPTLRDLHNFIGGALAKNIDIPGFGPNGNTCAVRLSRALNYGSMPISGNITKSLKIRTLTGGDGNLYIFSVREMKAYLAAALAVTPLNVYDKFGEAFSGKRGLVSFDVAGWSDATGHVALWNGSDFREPHDDYRNVSDNPLTPVIEGTKAMTLWEI